MNGINHRRYRAQLEREEAQAALHPSEVFVVSIKGEPTEVLLSDQMVRECIQGHGPHEVRVHVVPIRWEQ